MEYLVRRLSCADCTLINKVINMNVKMISFISAFLLLYGLLHYYIGLRGSQMLRAIGIRLPMWGWVLFIILLAMLLPLSRFAANLFSGEIAKFIIYAGSYWMAIIYYLLLMLLVIDIIRVINHWAGVIPPDNKFAALVGPGVLLMLLLIVLYGTWNANHPVVRNYQVSINQKASTLNQMRIVVVSDIHLGWIVGIDRIADMVKSINSLQPDLVLLAGDIIDEGVDPSAEQELPAIFSMINPRYGTYAVLGNHEYISGNVQTTIRCLDQADIKVLRDQCVKVDDNFFVVGRDDRSCKRFTGNERLELSKIMAGIDRDSLPIILLDHEPVDLETAAHERVDLQFSGHTHLGQLAPNNFITGSIYEDDWGYLKRDNLQIIVSCGFGTWGPPIRVGNRPEILNVLVKFSP